MQVRIEVRDGLLSKTEMITSSGFPLLDEAGLNAIRQWKFRLLSMTFVQKIGFRID
jgi:outer membrane biosynthesis protein TonB